MPKSQIVEPTKERQAGSIPFAEVPLNQYQNDLAKEKETYGEEALLGIYEDMLLIVSLRACCRVSRRRARTRD
jgi:hypothetical protein